MSTPYQIIGVSVNWNNLCTSSMTTFSCEIKALDSSQSPITVLLFSFWYLSRNESYAALKMTKFEIIQTLINKISELYI